MTCYVNSVDVNKLMCDINYCIANNDINIINLSNQINIIQKSNDVISSLNTVIENLSKCKENLENYTKNIIHIKTCKTNKFIKHGINGILINPSDERIETKQNPTKLLESVINESKDIYNTNVNVYNCKINVNCIKKLMQIPSSVYYYNGDKLNQEGLYINILNNYFRLPQLEYSRTVKEDICIYQVKELCILNKKDYCNKLHVGDKIFKQTQIDTRNLHFADVKKILSHAMNDFLICYIWLYKNGTKNIIHNLEYI